jgi:hypothetical protein
MPGAKDIIARVDEVIDLLLYRDEPNPYAQWMAGVLWEWSRGKPFDQAAGLPSCWRAGWRQRATEAALRDIARETCPTLAGRRASRKVTAVISEYVVSQWDVDRHAQSRPPGILGSCYDLLSIGPVPSDETIRRLLKPPVG